MSDTPSTVRQRFMEQREAATSARDWVDRLSTDFGITVRVAQVAGQFTGDVAVDPAWLNDQLTELAALRATTP
jgi:hypothetical protein